MPVYRLPLVPFKLAAVSRITSAPNGLYGTGALGGTLTPLAVGGPVSQKLSALYDGRALPGATPPYYVWGEKSGIPDSSQSTSFNGQAGTELFITGHIFSGWPNSQTEVEELCDKFVQLFHNRPITMSGYRPLKVGCRVVTIIPDPIGQHAIIEFNPLVQIVPA